MNTKFNRGLVLLLVQRNAGLILSRRVTNSFKCLFFKIRKLEDKMKTFLILDMCFSHI